MLLERDALGLETDLHIEVLHYKDLEATSHKTANTTLRNTMPSLYTHSANTTLGRQLDNYYYLSHRVQGEKICGH